MFEDVESFLKKHIGEDSANYVLEALALLDEIDYQDHVFPLRNALADNENHDPLETVGYIRSIVNDNYILILKEMSVEVAEATPLSTLYSLLFTLTNIETYELKDEIVGIIDAGESNEEILADLIGIFRSEDASVNIEWITSASSDLIEKIHDVCNKELQTKEETIWIDKTVIKENAKRFFLAHPGTYIRELIAKGFPIGQDKDIYVKALEERFSHFDPTTEQYTTELLALIIVNEMEERILPETKALVEEFVTDANEMIKVNALIDKVYLELFPYEKR